MDGALTHSLMSACVDSSRAVLARAPQTLPCTSPRHIVRKGGREGGYEITFDLFTT